MGTTINAKIIADSKNQLGNRITTMIVTFPRIILAEFNTHRMFSRNTASSRAIPFEKMVKSIEEDPFIPIAWQKDHKGMQGTEYFPHIDEDNVDGSDLKEAWLKSRDQAMELANHFNISGVTKQICNRLLEPFMWTTVIVTATEWENFFALRCPRYSIDTEGTFRSTKDIMKVYPEITKNFTQLDWLKFNKGQAEIHMMALAEAMWDVYNESTPKELKVGEWHIPFGDNIEVGKVMDYFDKTGCSHMTNYDYRNAFVKISTARCARISYTVVGEEKIDNYENDIKLHDRLLKSKHMSPFEHCARVMNAKDPLDYGIGWSGNFKGFIQYRKTIPNENII